MKPSSRAASWAWWSIVIGLVVGAAMGALLGPAQVGNGGDRAWNLLVVAGAGHYGWNWLMFFVGFTPFLIGGSVLLAASLVIEGLRPSESTQPPVARVAGDEAKPVDGPKPKVDRRSDETITGVNPW